MNLDGSIEAIIDKKGNAVHAVGAQQTILDALEMMAEKHVGALLVMEGDALVGIISERDYARKVALAGRSSQDMKVCEIMSEKIITVTPQDSVSKCMQYMNHRRCRHLPVLDEGKVIAVVSLGDLVNWIINLQDQAIHQLEDYIAQDYPA